MNRPALSLAPTTGHNRDGARPDRLSDVMLGCSGNDSRTGPPVTANYETVAGAADSAPWLVMVHGMSQDRRVFDAQVAAFRARCRILLIDLPGHGLSAAIPGPFGPVELAAQVAGALEQAGVDRCHYWATHTGTALGLLLAVERSGRFLSMILEGPVLPGHPLPSVEQALQQARHLARTAGLAEARRQWFDTAPWFAVMRRHPDACRAAAQRAIIDDFGGAPWLDDGPATAVPPIDEGLAAVDLPVLLYNGEHDVPDFVAAAARLQALLPQATRATIPDAGGFPAWEFPDRVNELVARFLSLPVDVAEQ